MVWRTWSHRPVPQSASLSKSRRSADPGTWSRAWKAWNIRCRNSPNRSGRGQTCREKSIESERRRSVCHFWNRISCELWSHVDWVMNHLTCSHKVRNRRKCYCRFACKQFLLMRGIELRLENWFLQAYSITSRNNILLPSAVPSFLHPTILWVLSSMYL